MFKKSIFFYLLRISFHYTHSNSHQSSDIKNRFWSMDDFERHSCNISYSSECDHLFRAQREYILQQVKHVFCKNKNEGGIGMNKRPYNMRHILLLVNFKCFSKKSEKNFIFQHLNSHKY